MRTRRWLSALLAATVLTGCGGLMKAHMKMSAGAYEEAIPHLEAYLAENPQSVDARSRLGFAYLKSGRIDAAVGAFEKVLRQEPGDPYAVLYLGLAYVNREQYANAIETWKGYRNREQPLVEDEIRRQLTLLRIAESQRQAERALAQEAELLDRRPPANTVAVLYYSDLTPGGRLEAYRKGLAAMIISDLGKVRSLEVVERLRLQALLQEMRLAQTGVVDARSAPRVGRLLGARNVVTGSLDEGSLKVTTTVNDQTSSLTVAETDFWQIPIFAVRTAVQALDLSLTPAERAAIGEPHTRSLAAFTFYGRALMAQDAGRWEEARDLFDQALRADPEFGLAGEGAAGSPGAGAPAPAALDRMAASAVAESVGEAVEEAAAQAEADQEDAAAAGGGDGGGGGGGGGGH